MWRASGVYSDAERSVLRLAEEITHGPGASAAAVAEARAHFSESDIVELVAACCIRLMCRWKSRLLRKSIYAQQGLAARTNSWATPRAGAAFALIHMEEALYPPAPQPVAND